jgi:cyclopropane-fatty-acyl-phospholipid synthase
MSAYGIRLAEAGMLPDSLMRAAIRSRHRSVLRREDPGTVEGRQQALRDFLREMAEAPVAPAPMDSNRQHYDVPPGLFLEMLGPRLKYSACVWPQEELGRRPRPGESESERHLLGAAEERTLELTAERAEVEDGMRILDLGCGWGSFSLWAAERFPTAEIVAVSNASNQAGFITSRMRERGIGNLRVITSDMNDFAPPEGSGPYDRVISVEMFEHMRNWAELLRRIGTWLSDDGRLFLHVFSHSDLAYPFREGPDEWMSRYFFTGGMMPSDSLLLHLQQDLVVIDHWRVSGLHYARTLDSWLCLLDSRRDQVLELFSLAGSPDGSVWFNRWRLFLLACSELFSYGGGDQWQVSQYLLAKRGLS